MDGDATADAEDTGSAEQGRWHAAAHINDPEAPVSYASTAPRPRPVTEPPPPPPPPAPAPEPEEPARAPEPETPAPAPEAPPAFVPGAPPPFPPAGPPPFAPPGAPPFPHAGPEPIAEHPVEPRPRRRRPWRVLAGVVAALLLIGVGVAVGVAVRQRALDDARAKTSASSARAGRITALQNQLRARDAQIAALQQQIQQGSSGTATTGPSGAAIAPSFGNGLFAVGTDIAPGQYRTEGAPACYWAKLSAGNPNTVLLDHLGAGPQSVTIDSPFFVSDSCGTWTKVG